MKYVLDFSKQKPIFPFLSESVFVAVLTIHETIEKKFINFERFPAQFLFSLFEKKSMNFHNFSRRNDVIGRNNATANETEHIQK